MGQSHEKYHHCKKKFPKIQIFFIGGGQMALALANGFVSSGLISASQILASAPSDTNLKTWREFNAETTHDNIEVIQKCDIVFLSVKPHIFPKVLENIKKILGLESKEF